MAPSSRCALAVLVVLCARSSFAQTDGGAPEAVAAPVSDVEALRRELDATRKDLKEMREEVRAQLATQSVAQGWSEDFVEEKRKLEVFVPDGYFRVRPELFHRMDLGRNADPSGYTTFPIPPTTGVDVQRDRKERTIAGVNMRFRFEPTFNISEEVRIRMQVDALDNVLMGSNSDYAFSRDPNKAYARDSFSIMSGTQVAPRSGINALQDSIAVKRVWGEVSTPVGILRFGRMGSSWGLGMTHNDGSCLDCDWGDTVDRLMFVAEPLAGFYVTPMIDFNAEGPTSFRDPAGGQPFDLSNSDDAHSLVIAIARRDTESQAKARLEAGQSLFNYGVHLTYKWQRNDPADFYGAPFENESVAGLDRNTPGGSAGYVFRQAQMWIPDIWVKFERDFLRIELEAAAVLGNINNSAMAGIDNTASNKNQSLGIIQFGGVLQGEVRLLDNALKIQLELGLASGDIQPGFGNYARRKTKHPDNHTLPGDLDGPQYACPSMGGCDAPGASQITNFRFNRDYRIDMILYRELLGGITDSFYVKPTVSYRIADGFNAFGSVIYSRAIFAESTPSAGTLQQDANLGFEINLGARYETEDGFFGELRWGILFPLGGFNDTRAGAGPSIDSAQALRGTLGIKF